MMNIMPTNLESNSGPSGPSPSACQAAGTAITPVEGKILLSLFFSHPHSQNIWQSCARNSITRFKQVPKH